LRELLRKRLYSRFCYPYSTASTGKLGYDGIGRKSNQETAQSAEEVTEETKEEEPVVEEAPEEAPAAEATEETSEPAAKEAPDTEEAQEEVAEESPDSADAAKTELENQEESQEEAVEETAEEEAEETAEKTQGESSDKTPILDSIINPHLKKTELKTSIGKQAKGTGRNWYVIHTYSGYEDAVEKALRQRIESLNMYDLIFDVIVPKESTITIKKGEHVTEKKRLFPGYVLVNMIVTDESWYVVRNTPNVTGFVGSGTIPVPVNPEEFAVIEKHIKKEEPSFKINFVVGEQVTISDGPFKNYEGNIESIDEKRGKLKVLVTIFGRETPVELDFVQVKKK